MYRSQTKAAFGILALSLGVSTAHAATIEWTGAISDVWDTTTANWTGDATTYAEGDDVTITGNGPISIDRDGDGANLGVNPGSTIVNVPSGTRTFTGGTIMSGSFIKDGAGVVNFSGYDGSFGFSSLAVDAGEFRYTSSALANDTVISVGTGLITLDNGAVFSFRHSQGGNPGVTVDNDFEIGAGGGEINTARAGGNPRTVFSGDVTLGGDLLLSKGGGGNNEPTQTYTGTITLTGGDRAIRGDSNFANGAHPVISGDIAEDQPGRQLTLRMNTSGRKFEIAGTNNTYSGGTVIESGDGFILVLDIAKLGTGDVTILDGGELRVQHKDALDPSAILSIFNETSQKTMALDFPNEEPGIDAGDMLVSGLILNGISQPIGLYDAASHPEFFSGTGQIYVIPEPASLILLGLGGTMLLSRQRR
ncbi:MAG: PEP-CTERM sorting domain-containing protein [Phycisphaeraceae bacterium]|nr:PEP-CTERM sorting domain-containing protein [Phycisphaeraceae bacterium]